MSNDNYGRIDELEKEFTNSEMTSTSNINNDLYSGSDTQTARHSKFDASFKEEFKAAFEEVDESKSISNKTVTQFEAVKSDGLTAGVYDWIRCVIFAIAIVVVCLTFVFRLVEVDGSSMDDTLKHKDKVIVTNLFYTPHDSDIVVISHGEKYNKPIIKRVIATAGQSIKLDYENDRIIVDGVVIPESYINGSTFAGNKGDNEIPDIIPEGKIFVMGDNRHVSLDSRSTEIGLIDVENVIGKAQIIAFPFDRFGYLYD